MRLLCCRVRQHAVDAFQTASEKDRDLIDAPFRAAIVIVKPETVLTRHRRGFRLFWTWKSRRRFGRPSVPPDVRQVIRTMAEANSLWAHQEFTANS
jgi:hypothetical protein